MSQNPPGRQENAKPRRERPTRARDWVLILLILHYANAYVDRVSIAVVAPLIQTDLGLDRVSMGLVFTAFSISYALFQMPLGRLADRFGPRRILSFIVIFWSAFTVATAFAWNRISLLLARFFFGVGEAGAFPVATRAVVGWFPTGERGFVQGITHTGARLGGALAPPLVALVATQWGWRIPFLIIGIPGVIWALVWYGYFRDSPTEHRGVNSGELALLARQGLSSPRDSREPWWVVLRDRNVMLLAAMYFCYVYCFWIFITWFPTYLQEVRGFELGMAGVLSSLPLLAGAVTNGLGGWVSDRLVDRKGLRTGRRTVAIGGFLLCVVFLIPAVLHSSPFVSVALFILSTAALEATTGVSWAAAVDIGEESAGMISGTMNTLGNLGGALSPLVFAVLVEATGSWSIPFILAGGLCLLAAFLWLKIDPEASYRRRR